MAVVPGADKILAIRGGERKLRISSSVSPAGIGPWTEVDCVDSAHLFAAGRYGDVVYVCAVDDCKVSIMVLEEGTGQFQLRYAFSTDKPTVCVKFSLGGESVFVVTDKIYQISLEDFQVRELSLFF